MEMKVGDVMSMCYNVIYVKIKYLFFAVIITSIYRTKMSKQRWAEQRWTD